MKLKLEELLKARTLNFAFADTSKVDAKLVREVRKKLGLTQLLFARMLHVSKKTVEKWEEGANPIKGGDALIVYLLSEDPYLANRLLHIEAINQKMPDRFKIFAPKMSASQKLKVHVSFAWPIAQENLEQGAFVASKTPLNGKKEIVYA